MSKKTIVINLFGAPGCGKSTIASYLFAELKIRGFDIELVSEFAKELVWEERNETMKDEIYIFAKQNHRFERLRGKVDIIITDRPIALSKFYNAKYGRPSAPFNLLVDECISLYENYNIFLTRNNFDYTTKGRLQSEEETGEFSKEMFDLYEHSIDLLIDSKHKEVLLSNTLDRLDNI